MNVLLFYWQCNCLKVEVKGKEDMIRVATSWAVNDDELHKVK